MTRRFSVSFAVTLLCHFALSASPFASSIWHLAKPTHCQVPKPTHCQVSLRELQTGPPELHPESCGRRVFPWPACHRVFRRQASHRVSPLFAPASVSCSLFVLAYCAPSSLVVLAYFTLQLFAVRACLFHPAAGCVACLSFPSDIQDAVILTCPLRYSV